MKKTLFLVLIGVFMPVLGFTQLRLDSLGKIGIGSCNSLSNAYMMVGNYNASSSNNIGIYTRISTSTLPAASSNIGIMGYMWGSSSRNDKTTGILGYAANGTSGKMYGIIGAVSPIYDGIGIYGTVGGYGSPQGEIVTGKYAGYFAGPTYVSGTLTATEVIIPSDITLKENIVPIQEEEETAGSALDNVLNMNVIKYNYKAKEYVRDSAEEVFYEDESLASEAGKISRQHIREMAEQKHYGLSAQELLEIYPDLVRTNQDGMLGVNYVELVPILIRSIQELKAELDELKSGDEKKSPKITDDNTLKSKYDKDSEKTSIYHPIILDGKVIGHKKTTKAR